jgi:hypothetical protein
MRSVTKSRDNLGHDGNPLRAGVIGFNLLYQRLRAVALTTSGLAIHGSGSAVAKVATAFRFFAPPSDHLTNAPILGLVAAATDTAAFVGTVTNAKFNAFVHTVSIAADGTKTHHTRIGTEGAARGTIVFPAIPDGEAIYGITEINPTGTGDFVGGTTALDDATVVPSAVFVSIVGAVPPLASADLVGNGDSVITS